MKTATSAFRGKISQIHCLHTELLALALHSQTESERKVSLVSYICRTQSTLVCFDNTPRSSLWQHRSKLDTDYAAKTVHTAGGEM